MRVGIFGGSFNPFHAGHKKLCQEALWQLNLDRLIIVPTYLSPFKRRTRSSARVKDRVHNIMSATRDMDHTQVSDFELKQCKVSYTIDTIKYFRKSFGKKAVLFFISGLDAALSIRRWKSYTKILTLCQFVAASRPGYSGQVRALDKRILYMPMDALNISSSELRKKN